MSESKTKEQEAPTPSLWSQLDENERQRLARLFYALARKVVLSPHSQTGEPGTANEIRQNQTSSPRS